VCVTVLRHTPECAEPCMACDACCTLCKPSRHNGVSMYGFLLGAKHALGGLLPLHCQAGWPHLPLAIAPKVPKAISDQSSDVAWLQTIYAHSSDSSAWLQQHLSAAVVVGWLLTAAAPESGGR
jgi:hypothetical protein